METGGNPAHLLVHQVIFAHGEETKMLQATRRWWAPAGVTSGRLLRPLRRFLERLFQPDRTATEDLPPEVKKDLGLLDGRPSRNRTEAYWSEQRRHRDWMRSGPF
ncbi:hypothetical protein C0075_09155 [Rhizobium sp. KAs_5_22]|nr:hypothetical protein C0075_09155 [Rhizobium sp. KAs_5_22]